MSKKHLMAKPHIFTFYHIFSKGFFLLTLPFLQQIFLHPESIWQQVSYTIFNILFIVVLITIICLEYKKIYYIQNEHRIILGKGLFNHSDTALPTAEVTAISVSRSIILWLAHCCRVYISSSSCCKTRKTELFVTNSSAKKIIEFSTDKAVQHILFKGNIIRPVLMSFTQSNLLTGSFALAVIFQRLSNILGEELTENVIQSFNLFPYLIATGLPPAFSYIGGFIFAGFLFGLLTQIFNNVNFTSFCNDKFIFVYKGLYRRNILAVQKKFLNGVLIRQTLIMCITNIYTISLIYIGIKNDKNSGVYVPITRKNQLSRYIAPILSAEESFTQIKPLRHSFMSYLYMPIIYLSITLILCLFSYKNFYISFAARFIAVVLLPFGILWIYFRIIAYKHSGIKISENTITLSYFNHLNLKTAIIKHNAITKAVITRNIFQKAFNKCHIIFYICDKKHLKIKIKHLSYSEALRLFAVYNKYCEKKNH